jgi:hypothetical protein
VLAVFLGPMVSSTFLSTNKVNVIVVPENLTLPWPCSISAITVQAFSVAAKQRTLPHSTDSPHRHWVCVKQTFPRLKTIHKRVLAYSFQKKSGDRASSQKMLLCTTLIS